MENQRENKMRNFLIFPSRKQTEKKVSRFDLGEQDGDADETGDL